MNLIPTSIAFTNLLNLFCRLLSCDNENRFAPPVNEVNSVGNDILTGFNEQNYENGNNVDFVNKKVLLEVTTTYGRVRGYYMTIIRNKQILAFEGIKYAESPTGDRRFKNPVPKSPWSETFIANDPGPPCMQLHYGRLRGIEDCLVINVYTKNLNPVKPYPVIVFIHGGFWLSGAGAHFGPAYLLDSDVILVTFNYRLGVLGHFSTGDNVASGNWGLKDQALAIEWVYNNIENFGGNKKRITLSGQSAGSVSTHLHMISNYPSKRRIASAISMSGTAYNIWGLNKLDTSRMVSLTLADASGCSSSETSQVIVSCLRQANASVLVANQLLSFPIGFFLPSIEPNVEDAFLTKSPDQAYSENSVANIPWIVMMTSRELNLPVPALQANVVLSLIRAAFNADLASLLSFRRKGVNEEMVREKIIDFYTKGGGSSANNLSQEDFSQIATDRYFNVPIHKAIQMHSQIAPTYASIFNYSSNLGRAGRRGFSNPVEFGILHGDDLVYFLNSTRNHPPIGRFDPHIAITKLLVNLYSNFAQNGEPLFTAEDGKQYKIWDAVSNQEKLRYLRIDEEVKMIEDPYGERAEFWEDLGIPDTTTFFRL